MKAETLQRKVTDLLDRVEFLVETNMESKGDKECDCQKLCVLNALSELYQNVNGIEQADMK